MMNIAYYISNERDYSSKHVALKEGGVNYGGPVLMEDRFLASGKWRDLQSNLRPGNYKLSTL